MEEQNQARGQRSGELLSQGKVARVDAYACGHVVVAFEAFKVGFAAQDFRDFAHTVAQALEHLAQRETERAEWGLFM